jgi:ubiquinone/menaquinone biosynthesis C-methylase UbiE
MSIRTRFFAATYDSFMKSSEREGLMDMRRGLVDQAAGRVLEIGTLRHYWPGTGLNLGHYGLVVNSLTITEPDPSMLKRLERRVEADRPATTVLRAPAEDLPFEDGTFDTVVSTLVLCGVDDQPRAVREIRRVLRPGEPCCSSSTCDPTTPKRPASKTA